MTLQLDDRESDTPAPKPQPALARPVDAGRMMRLCLKELREILRDRRTIVTLVFMPLLVYPLLSVAFQRFAVTSFGSLTSTQYRVGVLSEADGVRLREFMLDGERILAKTKHASEEATPLNPLAKQEPSVSMFPVKDVRSELVSGYVDVVVRTQESETTYQDTPPNAGVPTSKRLQFQLFYREDGPFGKAAVAYIKERLAAVNQRSLEVRHIHLPTEVLVNPIRGTGAAVSLTALVPLILILMTITGAVYPAIDLTAGERERGTLETLMAAPVPRLRLLLAKYVAVLTVALFTAVANLAAMTGTLTATGLSKTIFGIDGLSMTLVGQVLGLLILFATFFSAVLLAVTSFARSFKEAQAYLVPLMLLSLAPGMMSLIPDLEFNGLLAVTPLVNIVLLARDIFEGNVKATLAVAAVVSSGLYTFSAIALAARIFGTDAILYGSQATWIELLRRPKTKREAATVAGALFCLAALFPLYFLISNALHQLQGATIAARLTISALVTALLFTLFPILIAALQSVRLNSGFQLRRAPSLTFLAAFILGISLWPFAHEIFLLNKALGIGAFDPEVFKSVQSFLDRWKEIPPGTILLSLAIVPAVCEEFFFRGYLMGAFQRSMSPARAIAFSAILFGAFHVITTSALATERFLPSTLMGLVLGWVCYRTGSVFPGMLLHTSHNGLLVMMA